jgi:hypothetical protein
MSDDRVALEPCPFCGAAADQGKAVNDGHSGPCIPEEGVVNCGGCGLTTLAYPAQWNTRAALAPPATGEVGKGRLLRLLDALAHDCEYTDGWEEGAETIREAIAALSTPDDLRIKGDRG